MAKQHALLESLTAVDAVIDERAVDAKVCVHSLGPGELKQAVVLAYQVIAKVMGLFLVPSVGEASRRRLFKLEMFSGASGMKDLIAGWLGCAPVVAHRLLKLGKHLATGRFEKTSQALAQGEIDTDQATAIVDTVRRLPPELVNDAELDEAADTMLGLARGGCDSDILKASGRGLLEHIAPEKAVEYDEKQAERARYRAESTRCVEVTGFGVAGAKEFRVRAESETIDKIMKVIDPLTEPLAPEATGTDAPDQRLLERRRGDAFVELVDHMWSTDLLAELSPEQLEHLAAMLRAAHTGAANPDHGEDDDTDADAPADDTEDFGLTDIDDPCDIDDSVDRAGLADDFGSDQNDQDDQGDCSVDCRCECHDQVDGASDDQDGAGSDARSEHPRRHPKRRPGSRVRRGKGVWCKPCVHWRPAKPKVYIRTDYDHTTGRVTAAMLDTGERLSVKQVERLMCDADIVPVWMTNNMTPVAVAATCRYFRGTQLAALIARDFGCCFPGCTRGLRFVHAHHINPYKITGKTTADDGVLLCSTHHRLIHEGDWIVRIANDGKPEFIPPYWIDPNRQPRRHIRHQR